MVRDTGLIFSFSISLQPRVPFRGTIVHTMHSSWTLLCVPFIFAHHKKCGMHVQKSSIIFIVATLVAVSFQRVVDSYYYIMGGNEESTFQMINDITGKRGAAVWKGSPVI